MNQIPNLDDLFPPKPVAEQPEQRAKRRFPEPVMYVLIGFVAAGLTFSLFSPSPVIQADPVAQSNVSVEAEPVNEAPSAEASEALPNAEVEEARDSDSELITEATAEPTLPYKERPEGQTEPGTESGFPSELLDDAVALATEMRGSVVQIVGMKRKSGFGTGWLVQPDVVVTNEHVADYDKDYEGALAVKTLDGKYIKASVIMMDAYFDVAFLRLEEPMDAPVFKIYNGIVENGTPVIYTGHASKIGNWESGAGIVTDNQFYENEAIVTSLPTAPGASGSAIMNMNGSVVGIIAGTYWGTEDPGTRKPKEDVFIHTYMPRLDNNGGSNSLILIRLLKQHGISYETAE